jgi:hypothetical protein
LVQAEEDVYLEVAGKDAEANTDPRFEKEIDGDSDCKVLSIERASRR